MWSRKQLIASVLPAALLLGCAPGCRGEGEKPAAREVRVAAAANLKTVLEEIVEAFHRHRPEVQVKVTYGSSGNFFSQLTNRAPFDLFLSADVDYPHRLAEEGRTTAPEFVYAVGQIVVWVPNDSKLDLEKEGIRALLDPAARKIAIANPRHAPYGREAKAALENLKLYDRLKDRIVLGDNIEQTAQFVQSGAADAGILALSQALSPALRDKGRYVAVPEDTYSAIRQAGVILTWAQDREAAEALRDFLLSGEARAIFRRYGYRDPGV